MKIVTQKTFFLLIITLSAVFIMFCTADDDDDDTPPSPTATSTSTATPTPTATASPTPTPTPTAYATEIVNAAPEITDFSAEYDGSSGGDPCRVLFWVLYFTIQGGQCDAWQIEVVNDDGDQVEVDPTSGYGNGTFSVQCQYGVWIPYYHFPLTATITASGPGGTDTKSFSWQLF
ncbi:hypothetical protein JXQ70_05020 [bacterium]|nr:hypothetical protein [bacterium]